MPVLTLVNGELCDHLPVSDRGLGYGHGLFETIRVQRGRAPLWQRHLARLERAAPVLRIPLADLIPALADWRDLLLQHAAETGDSALDGILKILVTAGSGERGYALPTHPAPRIALVWQPAILAAPGSARLRVCATRLSRQPALAGIKHLNRLEQVLARAEWAQEWDEGIMLDTDGYLVECVSSNLFFRRHGQWYTPDLGHAGVMGVMRSLLLETAAPRTGVDVGVAAGLTLDDLGAADEVFLCNALAGIRPVVEVDGLGHWPVGAGTEAFCRYLEQHYGYPMPC